MNIGPPESKKTPSPVSRVISYAIVKAVQLFLTVVVGVFFTILVANLGGYIDEIFRAMVNETLGAQIQAGWLREVTDTAERTRIIEQARWSMEEAYGLHQPFILRTFRWLSNGLTLGLGRTRAGAMGFEEVEVRSIILQRLPYTLVLFGVSNLLLFFISIFLALVLSRKQGGLLDRANIIISALTSAPSWIHGLILTVVFAGILRLMPFPKQIDIQYASFTWEYIQFVLRQMILPVGAIFFSVFFQSIYAWRTYFLAYSKEDYVEVAQAKGLHPRVIERSYILRPSLPYVITSFALMLIGLWQGAIALELLFRWPGVGALFYQAIQGFRTPLLVGIVVIFAYLLAITVFLMDIFYALVDPRIRVGGGEGTVKPISLKTRKSFRLQSPGEWLKERRPVRRQPVVSQDSERSPRNLTLSGRLLWLLKSLANLKPALREITRYKSAMFGLAIIIALAGLSIFTVLTIPYQQVVMTWRGQGSKERRGPWYQNPKNALPAWANYFRRDKLPETIRLDSRKGTASKSTKAVTEEMSEINISFSFDYPYVTFPQDLVLYLDSRYAQKKPHISLFWLRPDGKEIDLGSFSITSAHAYYPLRDERLQRKLKGTAVLENLFRDPAEELLRAQSGHYELKVMGFIFEPEADLDAELVLYGQVFGLGGTDHQRRDLTLAFLWGTPVALAFGLLGAVLTSLIAMTLAAAGAWLGGWVDDLIQRITEVNLILPVLPIAILVYLMYSKSIWVILGVVVLLNIFGSSIKSYRAAFLQAKESPYIEAARAYGASHWRIIRRYLVPRILPVLIPQLVILVPGYVFYEATLAFLGVSDPYLPTWGKVIYDALTNGLYQGHYYWVLEPIGLLLLTGLAFALLGFALDRVLNPRLREY